MSKIDIDFGVAVCKALGIDWKNTGKVTIIIQANAPPTVLAEQYIRDNGAELVFVLKQYELKEK
jgi:hypothetical protein